MNSSKWFGIAVRYEALQCADRQKRLPGLACSEADSSGKLWTEVDKDIRVAACTPTDSGWESSALCDSKYLVLWKFPE